MPRTVREILTRAMRTATILGASDVMEGNDAADALLVLNQMMDAWQAERLFAYQIVSRTHALTTGVATYSIGPGGTIDVDRPVRIEWAFTRDSQHYDRPMNIVPDQVFASITRKDQGNNFPTVLYYAPGFPLGSIRIWEHPSANLVMHLGCWVTLSEFADLNSSVTLPPGYEQAIVLSMAELLSPEYGKEPSGSLVRMAAKARANIQQNNLPDPRIACEFMGVQQNTPAPYYRYVSGDF
jgi:hypothetical protein